MFQKIKPYLKLLLEASIAGGLGYATGGPAGAGVATLSYLYRNGLVDDTVLAGVIQALSNIKK